MERALLSPISPRTAIPLRHSYGTMNLKKNDIFAFPGTLKCLFLRNSKMVCYIRRKVPRKNPSTKISGSDFCITNNVVWDLGCAGLTMGGAYSLVSVFDLMVQRNFLDQKLSRKLVHILSGMLFIMSWPLFSSSKEARYIAAIVPVFNFVRLLVFGLSLANNKDLVNAVSRQGKPEELLKGPMYYVIVLICCTILFWRNSPVGMLSVAMMSAGDGIADIMGRRYGIQKLPYNRKKSWAGSISMFLFGFFISLGIVQYFSIFGFLNMEWKITVQNIAIIAMSATIAESLPLEELLDDNILVPMTCTLIGLYLF